MNSLLIGTSEHHGVDKVWVKVALLGNNLYFVELYIKPDSSIEIYQENIDVLRDLITILDAKDILLVSADFDLPNLVWLFDDPEKENESLDTCHELGLVQINKHVEQNGRILDLVLTTDADLLSCTLSDSHLAKCEYHHSSFNIPT